MRLMIFAGIAVAMAACQTKPIAELSYSELTVVATQIKTRCEAQGAVHPSPEYDLCIQHEVRREHATRAANAAQLERSRNALADGLGSVSRGYYGAAAATASTPSRSVSTTCRSVPSPAGSVSVSCY